MDAAEVTSDFYDWELLQSSSDSDLTASPIIKIDSGGILHADYFSLDARNRSEEVFDHCDSAISDESSSVVIGLEENPSDFVDEDCGEFLTLGLEENHSGCVDEDSREFLTGSSDEVAKIRLEGGSEMDLSEIDRSEVVEDVVEASGGLSDCSGMSREDFDGGDEKSVSGGKIVDDTENRSGGEVEKKSIVWWKMPVEFLKYLGFRMSPLWTVSVAAAAIGIVILSNRLYKMMKRKKTKGLGVNVAVDDKMASQVMNRASRLNEALSVVKRVRVSLIGPSHPAVGAATSWPVVSLR